MKREEKWSRNNSFVSLLSNAMKFSMQSAKVSKEHCIFEIVSE